jgi:hypothetical protein
MRRAVAALTLAACGSAPGAIATFDELPVGFQPTTFTSGGITFSHGLWFPDSVDLTFGITNENIDMQALGFGDTFSPPNIMAVGGFIDGGQGNGGVGFFRVHSWQATIPGETFVAGAVDVYYINDFLGATAYLSAMLGDVAVASDSFTITDPNGFQALHQRLVVQADVFDRIVFEVWGGPGGDANGLLAIFDNVVLEIPAPGTLVAGFGPVLLLRRRR